MPIAARHLPQATARLSWPLTLTAIAVVVIMSLTPHAYADAVYQLDYYVDLSRDDEYAFTRIELSDNSGLTELDFNLNKQYHSDVKASGSLTVKDGRGVWQPPKKDAWLSLKVKLNHKRGGGGYDSLRQADFAIFRGDKLIPAAKVSGRKGIESHATLHFTLPEGWTSVNSGWEKTEPTRFLIDNPRRRFDRPTGWFIAGKLGTRRERLPDTHIAISGPAGESIRRMDVLSFVMFNWPTLQQVVGKTPPKILMVMAGDPMWRGGLSGPNSLFLHSERPIVSENGTSTVLHELMHTITGIHGTKGDNWIAEGIAEYYSYTILHRAGGMTDERLEYVKQWLDNWSKDIKTLRGASSKGQRTARATLLLGELDAEINQLTDGKKSLDHAVRAMMKLRYVSLEQLREIVADLTGQPSKVLQSPLLNDLAD